jgi:hypothetical protein
MWIFIPLTHFPSTIDARGKTEHLLATALPKRSGAPSVPDDESSMSCRSFLRFAAVGIPARTGPRNESLMFHKPARLPKQGVHLHAQQP